VANKEAQVEAVDHGQQLDDVQALQRVVVLEVAVFFVDDLVLVFVDTNTAFTDIAQGGHEQQIHTYGDA
jgi:hypothetical protein